MRPIYARRAVISRIAAVMMVATTVSVVPSAALAGSTTTNSSNLGLPNIGGLPSQQATTTGVVSSEPVSGPGEPSFVQTVNPLVNTPSMAGQWSTLPYTAPGLAVHATLMNDGDVLVASGSGNNPTQFAAGTFNVWIWNPTAGTFGLVPGLPTDLFCSGHVLLPNGNVLFVGGTAAYPTATHGFLGTNTSYEFDPSTGAFTQEPDMANGRWYATAIEQGDGSILAVSGQDGITGAIVPYAEQFSTTTNEWSQLPGYQLFPTYPNLTLLDNGEIFYSGGADAQASSHAPGVWSPVANTFADVTTGQTIARDQAATVLLPPAQNQKIAIFGGGSDTDGSSTTATADVDIYNASNPADVTHSDALPMAAAKMHVLGVILPNETVFETGGGHQFAEQPVAEAAIYNPANGLWSQMAAPTVPRTYHSEAILLPNGQVATLGSNSNGYSPEVRIEVFSPPYMFNGQRPVITSAPKSAGYGGSFPVTVGLASGATLSKLVLIHPASVTHSQDPNQRLVEVPFTGSGGQYTATVPTNPNLTPPGWYMMFALDSSGRPSVASWIQIGAGS